MELDRQLADHVLAAMHSGWCLCLSMLSAGNLAPGSSSYPFSVTVSELKLFGLLCFKYIYSSSSRKGVIEAVSAACQEL